VPVFSQASVHLAAAVVAVGPQYQMSQQQVVPVEAVVLTGSAVLFDKLGLLELLGRDTPVVMAEQTGQTTAVVAVVALGR
jgi:hypothetical protein